VSEKDTPTCFVIQAFDGGKYDRRYVETIRPALESAGVKPERADEMLGVNPVIEKIEKSIQAASVCIAEVSEDNPNVWLELGYALALDRPTVIICDESARNKLPFDIQHRPVVFYRTDSRSGFEELEKNIVKWIRNELNNSKAPERVLKIKPGKVGVIDLEEHEVAVLSSAFEYWPTAEKAISHYNLEQAIQPLGYNKTAVSLGIASLIERGFLSERLLQDHNYNNEEYTAFEVTKTGVQWLNENKKSLILKDKPKAKTKTTPAVAQSSDINFDDDIPF